MKQSLGKEFARYAVPSVIGMVVSSLYTIVDGIFVGRGVGDVALAAVNIVYPFIMLQIALTMLVAVGGSNRFSFLRGQDDGEGAVNVFSQGVAILMVFGVVLNVLALVFSEQVCTLLGADEVLLPHSAGYLRWVALFGIIYMPGLGVSIFVRNDGAPGREMLGTLLGAVTNVILDYVFIFTLGMGIEGAAIATGIGQMVAVAVYTTHFIHNKGILRIKKPVFHKAQVKKVLYNGLPSFLMEFSQSAITLSFNLAIVAMLGTMGVAAYSIVMYICSIFNMVLIGITQGAQPLMSYNHGLGNGVNVEKVYRMGLASNLVLSGFFYVLILLFGQNLAGLFDTGSPELLSMASFMMNLYFLGFFPIGISLMNILWLQVTDKEAPSILISLLRCLGFVQVFLLVLPRFFGETGIYLSLLAGELVNCVISMLLCARVQRQCRLEPAKEPQL